ncbi:MAG: hypothetical protein KDD60_11730, partial [Bdellovibrionales bacterium]|nr:hypothetical protein [Bdellovibrionales bacterium]
SAIAVAIFNGMLALPLLADSRVEISATIACVVGDDGKSLLVNPKSGDTPLDASVVQKKTSQKLKRLQKKLKAIKKAGASPSQLKKLKRKLKKLKVMLGKIVDCDATNVSESSSDGSTDSPNGDLSDDESPFLRSEIELLVVTGKNSNGVTCELSTGISPTLSASFGGYSVNSGTKNIAVIGCRTLGGEPFEVLGGEVVGLIASPVGVVLEGRSFFSVSVEPGASSFVKELCVLDPGCVDGTLIHKEHRAGSPVSLRLALSLTGNGALPDFQGYFGGRGVDVRLEQF